MADEQGAIPEARVRDLAEAKAWLCARWHQDHPNEQHIRQLADYAAHLRATPDAAASEDEPRTGAGAIQIVRDYQTVADAKYLSVKSRIDGGEEGLELTLAVALGLSHQAREIHSRLVATHSPVPTEAGWQNIASAPRDGRDALVGCWVINHDEPEKPPVWSAWETVFDGGPLGCDGAWGDEPTHWHDMPAPPTLSSTQGGAEG